MGRIVAFRPLPICLKGGRHAFVGQIRRACTGGPPLAQKLNQPCVISHARPKGCPSLKAMALKWDLTNVMQGHRMQTHLERNMIIKKNALYFSAFMLASPVWACDCQLSYSTCLPCGVDQVSTKPIELDRSASLVGEGCIPCMSFCRNIGDMSSRAADTKDEKPVRYRDASSEELRLVHEPNIILSLAQVNPDAAAALHGLSAMPLKNGNYPPNSSMVTSNHSKTVQDVYKAVQRVHEKADPNEKFTPINQEIFNSVSYHLKKFADGTASMRMEQNFRNRENVLLEKNFPDVLINLKWVDGEKGGHWQPTDWQLAQ